MDCSGKCKAREKETATRAKMGSRHQEKQEIRVSDNQERHVHLKSSPRMRRSGFWRTRAIQGALAKAGGKLASGLLLRAHVPATGEPGPGTSTVWASSNQVP